MKLRYKKRTERLRRERESRRADRAARFLMEEEPVETQEEFSILRALEKLSKLKRGIPCGER